MMKKMLALALALCALSGAALAGGLADKIKEKGELVLATEATYPPYEFVDDGMNIVGADIWLGEQIAKALGVKLKVQNMAFDGIIPAVQSEQADIGLAAFTYTKERAEVIDFSALYENSKQLLIVMKGYEGAYKEKQDLAGKKLGAQLGSMQSEIITRVLTESELLELDTYPNLAMETLLGNIAGFVVDDQVGLSMVAQNDRLAVADFIFSDEDAGVGKAAVIKKGEEDFVAVVNAVIEEAVRSGAYRQALEAAKAMQ